MRPTQRLALIAEMVPGLKENRSTTSVARVLENSLGGLDRHYIRIQFNGTAETRTYGPWRAWDMDGFERRAEAYRNEPGKDWTVTTEVHLPRCQCEKCKADSAHILGLV